METLAFDVIRRNQDLTLSARDAEAIERLVSWHAQPNFAKPGRTAWYRLVNPVRPVKGGPLLLAAKLKGVGAWNPVDPQVPSGIKGAHPPGTLQPSVVEYEETARTAHFGIDSDGQFKSLHSESAPFGSILLRRAQQEYENAFALHGSGVPSIVPYALYRYPGLRFKAEPLGAVVSLAPDESPHSLDVLYLDCRTASRERQQHLQEVLAALDADAVEDRAIAAAQREIGYRVGQALRQFAQSGHYRYSSAWDNFYLNKRDGVVYLTDLDSSRRLQELPTEIAGMQVLRDLAGALWRLPKQYSECDVVSRFKLSDVRRTDPLAATLRGFFDLDEATARAVVEPLWDYFIPHWFLLKRQGADITTFSKEQRKSYRIDKGLFHCLATLVTAPVYRRLHARLGLPQIPEQADLLERANLFLGEPMDYIRWLLRDDRCDG